jgi:hypothetical protein
MPNTMVPTTGNDKLWVLSGSFTNTVKSSLDVSGMDANPSGIAYDDTDIFFCGKNSSKLWRISGTTSATVKVSLGTAGTRTDPMGMGWNGTDTMWTSETAVVGLFLQSGKFSATLKSSTDISGLDTSIRGAGCDGESTIFPGGVNDKVWRLSGFLTNTIKDSQDISGIHAGTYNGASFTDEDFMFTGISGVNKLWRVSGKLTSTVKDSVDITTIDTNPGDITHDPASVRLGISGFTPTAVIF